MQSTDCTMHTDCTHASCACTTAYWSRSWALARQAVGAAVKQWAAYPRTRCHHTGHIVGTNHPHHPHMAQAVNIVSARRRQVAVVVADTCAQRRVVRDQAAACQLANRKCTCRLRSRHCLHVQLRKRSHHIVGEAVGVQRQARQHSALCTVLVAQQAWRTQGWCPWGTQQVYCWVTTRP